MLHLLTRRCAFASSRLSTLHADALHVLTPMENPSSLPKAQQSEAGAERAPYFLLPLATDDPSQPGSANAWHRRPFDLVTTHFFLDCFSASDLARLIPAVHARLDPGALWVVSEFRIPPSGPTRLPARILVRLLYLAFRLLTGLQPTHLPEYAPLLRQYGLVPVSIRHSLAGLLTAEIWQLGPASQSSFTDPR